MLQLLLHVTESQAIRITCDLEESIGHIQETDSAYSSLIGIWDRLQWQHPIQFSYKF